MNTTLSHIFVGIDISKKFLDVHLHPVAKDFRVANSQAGINKLIQVLSAYTVVQIVFESSGGYGYLLKQELSINNYNTWQVQPRRIRAFIISEGIKAKTDKIDAQMIALFASQKRPKYHEIIRSQDKQKLYSGLTLSETSFKKPINCSILNKFTVKIFLKLISPLWKDSYRKLNKKLNS